MLTVVSKGMLGLSRVAGHSGEEDCVCGFERLMDQVDIETPLTRRSRVGKNKFFFTFPSNLCSVSNTRRKTGGHDCQYTVLYNYSHKFMYVIASRLGSFQTLKFKPAAEK